MVHIRPRAVTSADFDEIVRNALLVRYAARSAGRSGFSEPPRATLQVRALLLGAEVGDDVALFAGFYTLGTDDIRPSVAVRAARNGPRRVSFGNGFVFP